MLWLTKKVITTVSGLGLLLVPALSPGQSFNIDLDLFFGGPDVVNGAPGSSFAGAASQAGFWNRIDAAGPSQAKALFELAGAATSATIQATGGHPSWRGFNNPTLSGDFRLLMADVADANEIPNDYTFRGLINGDYLVYTYAAQPQGSFRLETVTVPGSTSANPQTVTGPMQGNQFQYLVTHAIHQVSVVNGSIQVTVGQVNTPAVAINGFQLILLSTYVKPSNFSVVRGIQLSGGVVSVANSDDSYLVFRDGLVLNPMESPVDIVFEGTTTTLSPSNMAFLLKAHSDSVGIRQSVSLYDFQAGAWIPLDARSATTSDSMIEVNAGGNPARFVSAAGTIKARVAYKQNGPISHYPWIALFDFASWRINP